MDMSRKLVTLFTVALVFLVLALLHRIKLIMTQLLSVLSLSAMFISLEASQKLKLWRQVLVMALPFMALSA